MEPCGVLGALDVVSERLLRAPDDATLVELHELHGRLEALAREALQTPAALPAGVSAASGRTSTTTENPGTTTGISIAATRKPGAVRGTAASSPSVRALALSKASVALRSTFPADEALIAALIEAAAREVQTCPSDSRKALTLAYLHAATYADRWRRAADGLLRHLPSDARTREARALLAICETMSV